MYNYVYRMRSFIQQTQSAHKLSFIVEILRISVIEPRHYRPSYKMKKEKKNNGNESKLQTELFYDKNGWKAFFFGLVKIYHIFLSNFEILYRCTRKIWQSAFFVFVSLFYNNVLHANTPLTIQIIITCLVIIMFVTELRFLGYDLYFHKVSWFTLHIYLVMRLFLDGRIRFVCILNCPIPSIVLFFSSTVVYFYMFTPPIKITLSLWYASFH